MNSKFLIHLVFLSFLFSSCGPVDGVSMAKEVCDCAEEANNIPKSNGNRINEFGKCWDLMDEYELELKEHPEKLKKFDACFPCIDTIQI